MTLDILKWQKNGTIYLYILFVSIWEVDIWKCTRIKFKNLFINICIAWTYFHTFLFRVEQKTHSNFLHNSQQQLGYFFSTLNWICNCCCTNFTLFLFALSVAIVSEVLSSKRTWNNFQTKSHFWNRINGNNENERKEECISFSGAFIRFSCCSPFFHVKNASTSDVCNAFHNNCVQ